MGKKIYDNLKHIIEIILFLIILGGVIYSDGKRNQTVADNKEDICNLTDKVELNTVANVDLKIAIVKLTTELRIINYRDSLNQ